MRRKLNGEVCIISVFWWYVSVRQSCREVLLGWWFVGRGVFGRDVVIGESGGKVVL